MTASPGLIAARNALSDPKSSPEIRNAARDLLAAETERRMRVLSDLPPPEDHRGPQMLAAVFMFMAGTLFGASLAVFIWRLL